MQQEESLSLDDFGKLIGGQPDAFTSKYQRVKDKFKQQFGFDFEETGGANTPMHRKLHQGQARDLRSKDLTAEHRNFIIGAASDEGLQAADYTMNPPRGSSGPHIHMQLPDAHEPPRAGEMSSSLEDFSKMLGGQATPAAPKPILKPKAKPAAPYIAPKVSFTGLQSKNAESNTAIGQLDQQISQKMTQRQELIRRGGDTTPLDAQIQPLLVMRGQLQRGDETPITIRRKAIQKVHQQTREAAEGGDQSLLSNATGGLLPNWTGDAVEKLTLEPVGRMFGTASTLVAGAQRDIGQGLNWQSAKSPLEYYNAVKKKLTTGEDTPGFEQPVGELVKLLYEQYGGDVNRPGFQLAKALTDVAFDPINYAAPEAALKYIPAVRKFQQAGKVLDEAEAVRKAASTGGRIRATTTAARIGEALGLREPARGPSAFEEVAPTFTKQDQAEALRGRISEKAGAGELKPGPIRPQQPETPPQEHINQPSVPGQTEPATFKDIVLERGQSLSSTAQPGLEQKRLSDGTVWYLYKDKDGKVRASASVDPQGKVSAIAGDSPIYSGRLLKSLQEAGHTEATGLSTPESRRVYETKQRRETQQRAREAGLTWSGNPQGGEALPMPPTTYNSPLKETDEIFSSGLENALQSPKMKNRMSPQEALGFLKNNGVKDAEIEAVGLKEWLEGRKNVTREELQDFAAGSKLKTDEVMLTEGGLSPEQEERLGKLSLRKAQRTIYPDELKELAELQAAQRGERSAKYLEKTTPGTVPGSQRELYITAPDAPNSWVEGHVEVSHLKNPIVGIRFNERVGANGERVLFIEEIQPPVKSMPWVNAEDQFSKMPQWAQANWHNIAIKRMLAYAQEHGFDRISWANGDMTLERWGYQPGEIKTGNFYDNELPNRVNKIFGKYGERVERGAVPDLNVQSVKVPKEPVGQQPLLRQGAATEAGTGGPQFTFKPKRNTIYTNREGMGIVGDLAAKIYGEPTPSSASGLTFQTDRTRRLVGEAVEALRRETDPARREALQGLIDQLKSSVQQGPVVIQQPRNESLFSLRGTARHEGIHRADILMSETMGGKLPTESDLETLPHWDKISNIKNSASYKGISTNHAAMEGAAYLGSGEGHRFGLTPEQSAEYLGAYFDVIAKTYGPQWLDMYEGMIGAAKEALENAKQRATETTGRAVESGESLQSGRYGGIEQPLARISEGERAAVGESTRVGPEYSLQQSGTVRQRPTQTSKSQAAEASAVVEQPKPTTLPEAANAPTAPGIAQEKPPGYTGIQNSIVNAEREARGAPPLEKEGPRSDAEMQASAKAKVDADPQYARDLSRQVIASKRPLTDDEVTALTYDRQKLSDEHAEATKAIGDALDRGDVVGQAEARARQLRVEADIEANDKAATVGGTEQGRAFRARQQIIRQDYTFDRLVARTKAATGKEVPPEMRAKLKDLSDKLQAAEAELERYRNKPEAAPMAEPVKPTVSDPNASIERQIRNEERAQRQAGRKAKKEDLDAELRDLMAEFGKKLTGVKMAVPGVPVLPEGSTQLIGKIVKNRVQAGVNTVEGLVDEVHGLLQNHVENLTKRNVRDLISGYGQDLEKPPGDLAKELIDLKRQMRLISGIEDVKDSGEMWRRVQQIVPDSPAVEKLKTELEEALKERGANPGAESAAESRLSGQIADLEKQLNEGETFGPKAPRQPVTNDKIEALKLERKRLEDELNAKRGETPEQRKAAAAVARQINEVDRQIRENDVVPKQAKPKVSSPRLDSLRAQLEELKTQRDAMRPPRASQPASYEQKIKAVKTRLQKQISDMEAQVAAGTYAKPPKKAGLIYDKEATALRTKRDELKLKLEEALKERGTNPRAESAAQSRLNTQIADLEKQLREGEQFGPETPRRPITNDNIESLKAERKRLEDELNAKRGETPEQRKAAAAVARQINEIDRQIKEGDVLPKPKKPQVSSPRLESLRAQLEGLKAQRDAMRPPRVSQPASYEQKIKAVKTRLEKQISEMEARVAGGQYTKPPKKAGLIYDKEATALRTKRDELKLKIDTEIHKAEMAERSWPEKVMDKAVNWHRGVVLSSVMTLGKLGMAGAQRLVLTPIENAIGAGLAKVPGISKIAAKAQFEGRLNLRAEARAFTSLIEKATAEDVWRTAKSGAGELDLAFGNKKMPVDRDIAGFFGGLHGALKTPVKRAGWFRRMEIGAQDFLDKAIKSGKSEAEAKAMLADPGIQMQLGAQAYLEAQKDVLMGDNLFTELYSQFLGSAGARGPLGKTLRGAGRFLLPVVKVPTNYVAETTSYVTGGVKGIAKIIAQGGIKNLTPQEADYVLSTFKKGAVGSGLFALGYMNADSVGGYYEPGKQKAEEPQFGGLRIFGYDVPRWMLHSPALEALQIGATVRKVQEKMLKQKEEPVSAALGGAYAGGKGLLEEVPFFSEVGDLAKASKNYKSVGKFVGELGRSVVIPPDVQKIAKSGVPFTGGWGGDMPQQKPITPEMQHALDSLPPKQRQKVIDSRNRKMSEPTTRYPQNAWQEIEMGIPGLRENLPKKPKVKQRSR